MRTGALGGTGLASPTEALLSEQRLLGASGALANLARQFRGQSKYPAEWSPYALFAAGEPGAWYDPSDFSTLFQDSAGTTPVTALGQPVGRVLDKSGRGNHLVQSTAASRPTVEARVNLLTYSEQLNNAVWATLQATVTADNTTAPDGSASADRIRETAVTNRHGIYFANGGANAKWSANTAQEFSIYAKDDGRQYLYLYASPVGSMDTKFIYSIVDLTTGSITDSGQAGGSTLTLATVVDAGNGWYRVAITGTLDTTTNEAFVLVMGSNVSTRAAATITTGCPSYAGDTTKGFYAWGADLRVASQSSFPYQRVTTATNYQDVGAPRYLAFDGVDDSLNSEAPFLFANQPATAWYGCKRDSTSESLVCSTSFSAESFWGAIDTTTLTPHGTNTGTPTYRVNATTLSPVTRTRLNTVTRLGLFVLTTQDLVLSTATLRVSNYVPNSVYRLNGRLFALIIRSAATDPVTIANAEQWVAQRTGVSL